MNVCMHTCVFVYAVAHTCTASMHVCVSHSVHTLSSPSASASASIPALPSSASLIAVQLGEAGPESKVQVCRLADESQRGSFPLSVCKYVVTLIERSFSSLQLSFLLFV